MLPCELLPLTSQCPTVAILCQAPVEPCAADARQASCLVCERGGGAAMVNELDKLIAIILQGAPTCCIAPEDVL